MLFTCLNLCSSPMKWQSQKSVTYTITSLTDKYCRSDLNTRATINVLPLPSVSPCIASTILLIFFFSFFFVLVVIYTDRYLLLAESAIETTCRYTQRAHHPSQSNLTLLRAPSPLCLIRSHFQHTISLLISA